MMNRTVSFLVSTSCKPSLKPEARRPTPYPRFRLYYASVASVSPTFFAVGVSQKLAEFIGYSPGSFSEGLQKSIGLLRNPAVAVSDGEPHIRNKLRSCLGVAVKRYCSGNLFLLLRGILDLSAYGECPPKPPKQNANRCDAVRPYGQT